MLKGTKGFKPDSEFSVLRRFVNKQVPIETPEELFRCFERARDSSNHSFTVHRMASKDFRAFTPIKEELINLRAKTIRNLDQQQKHLAFSHITQFRLTKSNPTQFNFKYTYSPKEPFKSIPLFKTDSNLSVVTNTNFEELPLKYTDANPKLLNGKKQKPLEKLYLNHCQSQAAKAHFQSPSDVEFQPQQVVSQTDIAHSDKFLIKYDAYLPKSDFGKFKQTFARQHHMELVDSDDDAKDEAMPAAIPSSELLPPRDAPDRSRPVDFLEECQFASLRPLPTSFAIDTRPRSCNHCKTALNIQLPEDGLIHSFECDKCHAVNLFQFPLSFQHNDNDFSGLGDLIDAAIDRKEVLRITVMFMFMLQ
jgi:hypothetical protein